VLVAEGSAIVMSLIQTGKIEAIVGISCLPVLERTFPYIEAAAIPAVAVPLLQDDCIDTTVDVDWVWDYIHLTSDDKTRRLNLNALHDEVKTWFTAEALDALLGKPSCQTEQIARDWLGRAGKRWMISNWPPFRLKPSTKPHSSMTTSKTTMLSAMASRHCIPNMALVWL
jgi:hypothetical protein